MRYRYIYDVINEDKRNLLQHNILKPVTRQMLQEMLATYGLRQKLLVAKEAGTRVSILDAGCGDGFFLQDLADLLDEQGLLDAARLIGVDINEKYLAGAEKRSKEKASWSKILYFVGDVTQPLSQNYSLRTLGLTQLDCICATLLLQYLPNARQHLATLYSSLKPGGILYLCDSNMIYGGEAGWHPPLPELEKFGIATYMVRALNEGKIVAVECEGWLKEIGAENIKVVWNKIQTGDESEASLEALRYYISLVRSVSPVLVNMGLINKAEQDELVASVYKITGDSKAQLPFIHTLASKPAENN